MNIVNWKYKPASFFDRMPNIVDNVINNNYNKEYYDNEWQPLVDIKEDSKSFTLIADIPGVKKNNIEVKIEDRVLIIKGDRKLDNEKDEADYHYQERKTGNFARSFKLPKSVMEDEISANFKDGTLTVLIPKEEKEQPNNRLISIK